MVHPVLKKMKVLREEAKLAIRAAFKDYFDRHPEIDSIKWTQYAPYFNDGDACVFHVHNFIFLPTNEYVTTFESTRSPAYDDDDDDIRLIIRDAAGVEYDYSTRAWDTGSKRQLTENETSIINDADELEELCRALPDEMRSSFTDDGEIVASRTGFSVDIYEHE